MVKKLYLKLLQKKIKEKKEQIVENQKWKYIV